MPSQEVINYALHRLVTVERGTSDKMAVASAKCLVLPNTGLLTSDHRHTLRNESKNGERQCEKNELLERRRKILQGQKGQGR